MIDRRPDQPFRDQPLLFGSENEIVDHGRRSRNETYREIVDELPERCRRWLLRILCKGSHGATIDELSIESGTPANKFSGRITEMKKAGMIQYTRERRPTSSGSTAAVIIATDKGKQSVNRQITGAT